MTNRTPTSCSAPFRAGGAFRYFKDTIHQLGLAKEWYAFRDECYREIARDFCLSHGIGFRE